MKSATINCTCGSSITLTDDAESFINEDESPDQHGRKFLIEVRADEWLNRHQKCIEAKVKLMAAPKKIK